MIERGPSARAPRWPDRWAAPCRRLDALLGVAEHHVLARLDLLAVEEADGAGDEHDVAAAERAVEERLARERALDGAALVAQHSWKMRSPERVGSTPFEPPRR
jgi:hypothetical protein